MSDQTSDYLIRRAGARPELKGLWDGPAWESAESLTIAHFRPESSDHRPDARAKLLYDGKGLYGIFRVQDRYVRSVCTKFQGSVCRDSCVEFFVQPRGTGAYLNFEFNCGGTFLCYWIEDPSPHPVNHGFTKFALLTPQDGRRVRIYHSLPGVVEPEIQEPTVWLLEFFIPFALIAKYAGPLGNLPGQQWRANFYKCGDDTSHPHWASWRPVDKLNFHLPHCFSTIGFEPVQPQIRARLPAARGARRTLAAAAAR